MLDPESDIVAVGLGVRDVVRVGYRGGDAVGALENLLLVCGAPDVGVAAVEVVVTHGLHPVIEEVVAQVRAEHIGSGHTAAAAASHSAHHLPSEASEAHVVAVVDIAYDTVLGSVGEVAEEEVAVVAVLVIAHLIHREIVSYAGTDVAHQAVHHTLLDREVEHGLLLTVVNSGELGLVGLLPHHLHLVDDLGREVLGSQGRVIHEIGLSVDIYLGDGLSVGRD